MEGQGDTYHFDLQSTVLKAVLLRQKQTWVEYQKNEKIKFCMLVPLLLYFKNKSMVEFPAPCTVTTQHVSI